MEQAFQQDPLVIYNHYPYHRTPPSLYHIIEKAGVNFKIFYRL